MFTLLEKKFESRKKISDSYQWLFKSPLHINTHWNISFAINSIAPDHVQKYDTDSSGYRMNIFKNLHINKYIKINRVIFLDIYYFPPLYVFDRLLFSFQ